MSKELPPGWGSPVYDVLAGEGDVPIRWAKAERCLQACHGTRVFSPALGRKNDSKRNLRAQLLADAGQSEHW